jgi:hypothetical protein
MSEISHSTKKLISQYRIWQESLNPPKERINLIHVDEVASKVAAFYEKIRGIIDWQDEHLFRRKAIERNLKRHLFLNSNSQNIANDLILELIRGGHFLNDFIPESKINEVQKMIDKYIYILENSPSSAQKQKKKIKIEFQDWILGIMACELEEILSPPIREKALINYMTEVLKERIRVVEGIFVIGGLKDEDLNTQIYITVQQALFKLDSYIISYNLLKLKYPEWSDLSKTLLQEITKNIYSIQEKIEKDLNHPLIDKFYKICEKYDTPYLILNDIISENPTKTEEIISQPEILEQQIRRAYAKRAATIKSRLKRAAFYCLLSVFFTDFIFLYTIEIPLVKLLWGEFTLFPLLVNIFIPTLFMFLLIITIKLPPKENIDVTIMEVVKIIYEGKKKDIYEIKVYSKKGFIMRTIITIFYIICFTLFWGIISWGLIKIKFPPTSIIIFILFISLISFAGIKIRQRIKEIEIIERKESFFYFFIDLFAVPVTHFGKWLSNRWKKINIISKFFTMLIDMPFQVFVKFLEQWRYFLKERKEEIH